jgi:hypothetical protein
MSVRRRYLLLCHAVSGLDVSFTTDPAIATKVVDDDVDILIVPIGIDGVHHILGIGKLQQHYRTGTQAGWGPSVPIDISVPDFTAIPNLWLCYVSNCVERCFSSSNGSEAESGHTSYYGGRGHSGE